MKKYYVVVFAISFLAISSFAQVGINSDNSAPDPSAMLDVKSTSKGFLLPRVTCSQMLQIQNPIDGLMVYCTTDRNLYIYDTLIIAWKSVLLGQGSVSSICGLPFIINHTAGNVAPVTKTVNYSTITNIQGEPTKCWLTSNLGSDHQAIVVTDATEASAGWYWQFNRKQGYKHDGSTLTPAWTITSTNENSDWLTANDPCNLELGPEWRLPTYTEWHNVYYMGGWTTWNSPWDSGLKLHTAGYLEDVSGSLFYRGSHGFYWSSTQCDSSTGWTLNFYGGNSEMSNYYKANGFSVRCLRDNN